MIAISLYKSVILNQFIKQFLIIGSTFIIILWFQNLDDKKNKKERISQYEKFKLPVLVAAIIGLILNISMSIDNYDNVNNITLITPVKKLSGSFLNKPFINNIDKLREPIKNMSKENQEKSFRYIKNLCILSKIYMQ